MNDSEKITPAKKIKLLEEEIKQYKTNIRYLEFQVKQLTDWKDTFKGALLSLMEEDIREICEQMIDYNNQKYKQ